FCQNSIKFQPSSPSEVFEIGFFTQPVDHFDNQNPYTFSQRYFKNEQWAKPGGPIFLMIGGESAGSPLWVLNGKLTYLKWAKMFGAATKPYASYLSSMQMLYDVANFIRTVNVELDEPAKWIVFGGSYA
ncbi:hypothetical protein OSTOST_14921, partial [Ostertagia ostertagi]